MSEKEQNIKQALKLCVNMLERDNTSVRKEAADNLSKAVGDLLDELAATKAELGKKSAYIQRLCDIDQETKALIERQKEALKAAEATNKRHQKSINELVADNDLLIGKCEAPLSPPKGESPDRTPEFYEGIMQRDQETILEQRDEINKLKQKLNQARQKQGIDKQAVIDLINNNKKFSNEFDSAIKVVPADFLAAKLHHHHDKQAIQEIVDWANDYDVTAQELDSDAKVIALEDLLYFLNPKFDDHLNTITKEPELTTCASNRDGECNHKSCPQLRDNEPGKTGRSCPLPDVYDDLD